VLNRFFDGLPGRGGGVFFRGRGEGLIIRVN